MSRRMRLCSPVAEVARSKQRFGQSALQALTPTTLLVVIPLSLPSRIPPSTAPTGSMQSDHLHYAVAFSRFVTHYFRVEPAPRGTQGLDQFIAAILHRTSPCYSLDVAYSALYLLGFLKQRFYHNLRGNSWQTTYKLFLAAYIIAGKSIYDAELSIKASSFTVCTTDVGIGREDIITSEREMLRLLDWKVNIYPDDLKTFKSQVVRDFSRPAPYPHYTFNMRGGNEPVELPSQAMKASSLPGHSLVSESSPGMLLKPDSTVTYTRPPSPPRTRRGPPVMQQVYMVPPAVAMRPVQPVPVHHRAATMPVFQHASGPPMAAAQMRQVQRGATIPVVAYAAPAPAPPPYAGYATGMSHASAYAAAQSRRNAQPGAWVP
ncbi:hypothetical protein C8Q76DRAFT_212127 [Earliella scabrosa]|nr:hypothetical protein C8Q76DRAFT_212127 [Earliella scabrosa]